MEFYFAYYLGKICCVNVVSILGFMSCMKPFSFNLVTPNLDVI